MVLKCHRIVNDITVHSVRELMKKPLPLAVNVTFRPTTFSSVQCVQGACKGAARADALMFGKSWSRFRFRFRVTPASTLHKTNREVLGPMWRSQECPKPTAYLVDWYLADHCS